MGVMGGGLTWEAFPEADDTAHPGHAHIGLRTHAPPTAPANTQSNSMLGKSIALIYLKPCKKNSTIIKCIS